MTTSTTADIDERTERRTCQAFAGSLVAPCPNAASTVAELRGQLRGVCPAHALRSRG